MVTGETGTTRVRTRANVAVIDLGGDIDAHADHTLETAWEQATASEPAAVVLNFENAGYINSTGIALIVGLLARSRARGVPLRAFGMSPHYREIFEITRLADYMTIDRDEDSAVGAEGSTA